MMELIQYVNSPVNVATLVLVITWLVVKLLKMNQGLPPGPRGLPFLGYYPALTMKIHLDFAKLAKKYGDVFSLRTIGGKLMIIVSGPKMLKDVFVARSSEFIGRPLESNPLAWISDGLGITPEEGAPWKEHRNFFLQTVRNFGFGKLEIEPTIQEEIKILKDDLMKANGEPTDFNFHISYTISCVISKILFATRFDKYGDVFPKLSEGVHDMLEIFTNKRFLLVGNFQKHIVMKLFPWSEKVRRAKKLLKGIAQDIINDHIKTFDPNHIRDFVDSYLLHRMKLQESNRLEKSTFTMEQLLAISMNMLMEGTGQFSIVSLLTELSKHPEEQKKVQAELDAVLGRDGTASWTDRHRLPHLEACMMELHRTAMAFYITSQYSNFEETQINGYRIPKRSIVLGNLWTINNDPELFPNPSKFDPSRFLDDKGERIKTEGPYPFSIGKRDCMGQSLAQIEIFLILASLLQNFTLYHTEEEGFLIAKPRTFH